jgi:hypothetical protein
MTSHKTKNGLANCETIFVYAIYFSYFEIVNLPTADSFVIRNHQLVVTIG